MAEIRHQGGQGQALGREGRARVLLASFLDRTHKDKRRNAAHNRATARLAPAERNPMGYKILTLSPGSTGRMLTMLVPLAARPDSAIW